MESRPVLVRALDAHSGLLQELLLNIFAVVQIEFPLNDLPGLGIDVDRMVFADSVGAVSTVLGSVLFWILCEQVPVRSGGELPARSVPAITELRISFHGLRVSEVGDGIEPLDGNSAAIMIYRI